MSQMPRERTPGGPIFGYPFPDGRIPRNRFPSSPFPSRPDLEIPGGLGDLIFREPSPSRESCAECRSRQDPNVMNIVDPCMNQCSGGAGDFKLPDIRVPDRFPEPRPRPRSSEYPVDFPRVDFRDRGVNDVLIPAAQLLGEFLGRLMK